MKIQLVISDSSYAAGATVTLPNGLVPFAESDIVQIDQVLGWWATQALTREDYLKATYDGYGIGSPPAANHIMFNADCTAFKCGNALFFGELVVASVVPLGSRVKTS